MGTAPSAVDYFFDENHRVWTDPFTEVFDEHRCRAVDDFFFASGVKDAFGEFVVRQSRVPGPFRNPATP